MKKKVIIIGAGPGGLSSAMILAYRGYDVSVYEKQGVVGGRTSPITGNGFTFELGPTFVMLPGIFEEIFTLSGKKLSDYINWKKLDTLYRLKFDDGRNFVVSDDKEKLKQEIARLFPGDEKGYDLFLKKQKKQFERMYPCLKIPYESFFDYFRLRLLRALPYMNNFSSLYDVMSRYFKHEDMKISMTFQAKYLGMSPWHCPGAFSILSYIEHEFGIYHPIGGVHKITEAMAKVATENGAKINLNSPIKEILIKDGKAVGVLLEDGTEDFADTIIMNADFAAGMTKLIPKKYREHTRWSDKKIEQRPFSCSTFMLYLGLKKKYDTPHHSIFFAKDYKENIAEIFDKKSLPQDPSFYIQNASVTDDTLAPEGKSALYVLVPVPNLSAKDIDWNEQKEVYKELVLKKIAEKTEFKDIKDQIEFERVITPLDWERKVNVYKGAVFNLAHTLGQMLYLRPHNKFESIPGLFIVGGGTHPGSGLPTILESGRITADLIDKQNTKKENEYLSIIKTHS